MATGGWDGTIRLWDADTGTLKHIFTGHRDNIDGVSPPSNIYSVSFSPDGQTLVSGGRDTIFLWDLTFFIPTLEIPADVNDDGIVNIQDLVQVAGAIGN